ncbi:Hypothetical predicted protein [Paramuricea clavata]|uniref:Uncharacterized protein n=1 Tax=Paramuricea clavata TaxID=317549 RepID=A0A7D9E453_PARCT|nr:Hypothetical predicted protein [Paramuricea clavata]
MPFVVVQIRAGTQVLKPWIGVRVPDNSSLNDVYNDLVAGILDQGEPIDDNSAVQLNNVHVHVGKSKKDLTRVDSQCTVAEVVGTLGNFIEFTHDANINRTEPLQCTNAFHILTAAARTLTCVPSNVVVHNQKDKLKNDIISWLKKNGVGWSLQYVETLGNKFLNTLADVMWYIDGNHVTLSSRSCAVPDSFAHFQGYNTPEKRKRKRIAAENLKQAELLAYSGTLFELAANSFMKSDAWKCLYNAILRLATNLRKYADFLNSVNMAIHHNKILKGADETDRVQLLQSTAVIKPTFQARYKQLHTAIAHADKYEVICANDYSPVEPTKKYSFFKELQVPVKCVLFTYTGAREHLSFIWKVPLEGDEAPEYLERNNKNIAEIKNLPHYHTRAMRREFVHSFGQVTNSKPALLREAYRRLTGDRSAASSLTEAEVDARVAEMLELEDPDLICDLRVNNAGRPQEYIVFLEKCQQYIERQVETAVDDRRHDPTTSDGDVVTHLATAMNTRHLYDSVVKDCGDGIPTPSIQWLRLQFWPRRCNSLSATRQKGTLRIKFMVQARQFRKSHVDVHYASSLFRYQKEFAVKFREYCSYISCDDKHTIKVGEPGFPVASAERGKQVLVDMNTKFQVGDHDFTKFKFIPSVHLDIAIPEDIQGSFYRGKVHVGLKDSCFESSSGLRHMTELRQIMEHSDTIKPMLLMHTDGGPDHRTTYLSVQIPLIAYFLDKDLDFLCAVRTPPYHSWKNPAERIMSILNCALQSVGLMRTSTDKEELLKKCGNTTEI